MNLLLEVKCKGGLGNQLFQYATGRNLCIKNKIPYLLLNDETFKTDSVGRVFGLKNFQTKGLVVKSEFIKKVLRRNTKYNKIFSALPFYKSIFESDLRLQPLWEKTGIVTSLEGYWQSEFYFKEIRSVLLEELVPAQEPAFPVWIAEKNTVAVHVRRTDYLTEDQLGFLGESYYQNAMERMKNLVENPLFIFFSDDISWCKEKFSGSHTLFCEDSTWAKDYLQLFLMSKCSHQVIANSSFSWWGAWLNNNPGKTVLRPVNPFLNEKLMYESYYPAEWIGIDK
jgi:Glycosyl transferase family 11